MPGWGRPRREALLGSAQSWSPVGSVRRERTGEVVTVTVVSLLVASAAAPGDGDALNPKQRGFPASLQGLPSPAGRSSPSCKGCAAARSPPPAKLAYSGMGNTFLKLAKMH